MGLHHVIILESCCNDCDDRGPQVIGALRWGSTALPCVDTRIVTIADSHLRGGLVWCRRSPAGRGPAPPRSLPSTGVHRQGSIPERLCEDRDPNSEGEARFAPNC